MIESIKEWLRKFYYRLFPKKRIAAEKEKLVVIERKKKIDAEHFKGVQDFFKSLKAKMAKDSLSIGRKRRLKLGGRGYTKSRYDFKHVKRRRKIAKASRRRNRGTK